MKTMNFVIAMALALALGTACGASSQGAAAESADQPGDEETADTALGNEEAPAEEAAVAEDTGPADATSEEEPTAEKEGLNPSADPNAPPPSDDLNAYVGTGGTTPEYRTVTANMDLIKRCYLDQLGKNPDLKGVMKISFTVNKKGKVTKASAVENELTKEVAACVVKTIKKLSFPKREDSRTVEYPFKFFPSPSE